MAINYKYPISCFQLQACALGWEILLFICYYAIYSSALMGLIVGRGSWLIWVSCAVPAALWNTGLCPLQKTVFNHFPPSLALVRNMVNATPSCLKHLGLSVGKCQQITFCQCSKHLSAPQFLFAESPPLPPARLHLPWVPPWIFFKAR